MHCRCALKGGQKQGARGGQNQSLGWGCSHSPQPDIRALCDVTNRFAELGGDFVQSGGGGECSAVRCVVWCVWLVGERFAGDLHTTAIIWPPEKIPLFDGDRNVKPYLLWPACRLADCSTIDFFFFPFFLCFPGRGEFSELWRSSSFIGQGASHGKKDKKKKKSVGS